MVKELIALGADPNAKTLDGRYGRDRYNDAHLYLPLLCLSRYNA